MKTTYIVLVNLVSDEFETVCNNEGFETFAEMVRCYQMDSADIKREVCAVVCSTKSAYMDEENGDITCDDAEEPYKYRPFIAAVKKELKRRGY